MCHYEYEFVRNVLRDSIDLTKHKQAIESGLRKNFPHVVNIKVHKNFFEFELPEAASLGGRQWMGRRIIAKSGSLASLVRKYDYKNSDGTPGKTKQLFKVKKN